MVVKELIKDLADCPPEGIVTFTVWGEYGPQHYEVTAALSDGDDTELDYDELEG